MGRMGHGALAARLEANAEAYVGGHRKKGQRGVNEESLIIIIHIFLWYLILYFEIISNIMEEL